MIERIDFDKLLPYKDDKKHSFEEMCYQLSKEEYGALGKFTSIDDSGGGDGVEYYLTFLNGDVWGWQCKFFDRFNESGRKEQIKKSLKRAYDVHGCNLKKWFLCSKNSLTIDEEEWFHKKLKNTSIKKQTVVPATATIELEHWGDSELLDLLRKHPDVYAFFFNERIVSIEWFKEKAKVELNKPSIKAKYNPVLHSWTKSEEKVCCVLGGKQQADYLNSLCSELSIDDFEKEYNKAIYNLINAVQYDSYKSIVDKCKDMIIPAQSIVSNGNVLIHNYIDCADKNSLTECIRYANDIEFYYKQFYDSYQILAKVFSYIEKSGIGWTAEKETKERDTKHLIEMQRNIVLDPYFVMRDFFDGYCFILLSIMKVKQNELHITGKASQGKSHIAINLFYNHYINNLPSILLLGREFKNTTTLERQILQLLDLPDDWNFEHFLQIMDWYGKLYDSKMIFVIDGLNENLEWKSIWKDNIDRLISEFNRFNHILLVTTYRSSYEEEIFSMNYFHLSENENKQIKVSGEEIDLNDAIRKYADYYKVKVSFISPSAIRIFSKQPLCLQIFFESNQGRNVEIKIDTAFQAFNSFVDTCIKNIANSVGMDTKFGRSKVNKILTRIVMYIWNNDVNVIPLIKLEDVEYTLLEAFDKEDLLVYRDFKDDEVLCFTYDLIAGYLIAKAIIKSCRNKEELYALVCSNDFQKKLVENGHPLFDVILSCFVLLVIRSYGFKFCSTIQLPIEVLIEIVYEISNKEIESDFSSIETMLKSCFEEKFYYVIPKALGVALEKENMLNFSFTSSLLKNIQIAHRDLKWTEFIRDENKNYNRIHQLIKGLDENCRNGKSNPDKLYLGALVAMWCLTSVSHQQRYDASKALYWYGRKFPEQFVKIVESGNEINDIYVPERLFAVSYGIALTIKQGKEDSLVSGFLKPIVNIIIKRFSDQLNESNCHYLLRLYCRGIIDIAKEHGIMVSQEEEGFIYAPKPTYTKKAIEGWEEIEEADSLIRMDFSNYQLGYLIPQGHSYANPPLKKKCRWFLHDRIQKLGWNVEDFQYYDNIISSYSFSRHNDNTKIDRYGKKYSWIAYYELAGILDDLKMLDTWGESRPIIPDLDLTFPEPYRHQNVLKDDYLGDESISSQEWIEKDIPMNIQPILYGSNIDAEGYVCIYGFFATKNTDKGRKRFAFIRPLIIKDTDYDVFCSLLKNQDLSNRWLPEIRTNYKVLAGEMYHKSVTKLSNWVDMDFVIGYNEEEYNIETANRENSLIFENLDWLGIDDSAVTNKKRKHKVPIYKTFKVLLPTMEYNFENEYIEGIGNCISFEIFDFEELQAIPQSFEVKDKNGMKASINLGEKQDYENDQEFVYLRKDILGDFLFKNGLKMVWAIWGEKDYAEPLLVLKAFQQIEEYIVE